MKFDLTQILSSMPLEVRSYQWCFEDIEAVGKDILVFETKVSSRADGVCMAWEELISTSGKIDEVINLTLVAKTQVEPSEEIIHLEVIDSSLWAIETEVLSVISWIRNSFEKVTDA